MPRKNNIRRKTLKKGGAFLGQGAYGCVFSPAIRCKNENDRRVGMISKLLSTKHAQQEWSVRILLEPIDPAKRWFIWPEHACEADLDLPENDFVSPRNATKRCTTITSSRQSLLLMYENGGEDVYHKLYHTGFANDYEKGQFLVGIANLLDGLAVLHAANVAHLDIKLENLLAKPLVDGSFSVRFIDFGLATNVHSLILTPQQVEAERVRVIHHYTDAAGVVAQNKLDKWLLYHKYAKAYLYAQNYPFWPYELRFLDPAKRERAVEPDAEIDAFYAADILGYSRTAPIWVWDDAHGGPILKTREGKRMLADTKTLRPEYLLKGADIFALGLALAAVFSAITGETSVDMNTINSSDKTLQGWQVEKHIGSPFWFLISRMLSPSVLLRPSAAEAAQEYHELIPHIRLIYGLDGPAVAAVAPGPALAGTPSSNYTTPVSTLGSNYGTPKTSVGTPETSVETPPLPATLAKNMQRLGLAPRQYSLVNNSGIGAFSGGISGATSNPAGAVSTERR